MASDAEFELEVPTTLVLGGIKTKVVYWKLSLWFKKIFFFQFYWEKNSSVYLHLETRTQETKALCRACGTCSDPLASLCLENDLPGSSVLLWAPVFTSSEACCGIWPGKIHTVFIFLKSLRKYPHHAEYWTKRRRKTGEQWTGGRQCSQVSTVSQQLRAWR